MKLGKPRPRVMADTVFRLNGSENSRVLVGPSRGVDTSVLKIGRDQVMILGSDPVSLIPEMGPSESAWLSVHASASDVATSGIAPQYAMFDLNLPPSLPDKLLREYWQSIHRTCKALGISILGGHTGRFEGCDYTVVGGVTMFAIGKQNAYVTSSMAQSEDDLIATKSAAIETTAILARCFPRTLERSLGRRVLKRALALMKEVSVLEDALAASSVGLRHRGVTAMHDVTEGGILSAVLEMADASKLKAVLQSEAIPVADETEQVCSLFKINPLYALGQGSLIIASRPKQTLDVCKALHKRDIASAVIGKLVQYGKHRILQPDGRARTLSYPKEDPYWNAYWKAVKQEWS